VLYTLLIPAGDSLTPTCDAVWHTHMASGFAAAADGALLLFLPETARPVAHLQNLDFPQEAHIAGRGRRVAAAADGALLVLLLPALLRAHARTSSRWHRAIAFLQYSNGLVRQTRNVCLQKACCGGERQGQRDTEQTPGVCLASSSGQPFLRDRHRRHMLIVQ
jgi:hypothetical protein